MRGCLKFDENPAVVSLCADLRSYCICSLGCAKVSQMHGSECGAFSRTVPLGRADLRSHASTTKW